MAGQMGMEQSTGRVREWASTLSSQFSDVLMASRTTSKDTAESLIKDLFSAAGVEINGSAPHDITVHNRDLYMRILRDGDLGIGESYMEGWWDCDRLEVAIEKLLRANLHVTLRGDWKLRARAAKALVLNMQSRKRATGSARAHYDIGNDLYKLMLCPRMQYTCAYYKDTDDLAEAQELKLDLICRKLQLKPGMKVLELGSGWGGLSIYMAEKHGVEVTAYNVSKAQVELAKEMAGDLPITFNLADYREAQGTYDAVVSVGMMEHIGYKNHRTLMQVIERSLKPEALAVIHTIGNNESRTRTDAFVDKYLFPNAVSPSIAQIGKSIENLLVMEDVHNIGPHYSPTLMAWCKNFEAGYDQLDHSIYDQQFYRMWRYYLLGAAAMPPARYGELWHWVFSKYRTPQRAQVRFS